jgi:hypothetical protein
MTSEPISSIASNVSIILRNEIDSFLNLLGKSYITLFHHFPPRNMTFQSLWSSFEKCDWSWKKNSFSIKQKSISKFYLRKIDREQSTILLTHWLFSENWEGLERIDMRLIICFELFFDSVDKIQCLKRPMLSNLPKYLLIILSLW